MIWILEMYDVVILMDFESILIWWNDFRCALTKVHELEQYGSSNLISTIEELLEFSAAGILQHMAGLLLWKHKAQIGQSPGHLDLESGLRINFLSKTFWTFTVSCFYFRFSKFQDDLGSRPTYIIRFYGQHSTELRLKSHRCNQIWWMNKP